MRAMQLPDSANVVGDFSGARFEHFGEEYVFIRDGEVETDGDEIAVIAISDGNAEEADTLKVAYVFGHDPLQQVLLSGERGRLQALTVAWGTEKESWYSLYPDFATPPGDQLHWQSDNLNWNYMCASCHSTGLKRGYDLESDSYETTWQELTVGCEACHGPGSEHAEDTASAYGMTGVSTNLADIGGREGFDVQNAELNMCASCHSRRSPLVEPPVHDAEFLDQYAPTLIQDGLYYPDGQVLEEVYVYASFLQSKMAQAGITCSDCHDPHSGERRLEGNALCLSCHAGGIEERAIHQVHEAGDEIQASCEDCHMPSRVYMGVDSRRDHQFGVPNPISAHNSSSPSVCQDCHENTSADWASELIERPVVSSPADAAVALAQREPEALETLIEVLIDSTTSRIMKGSLIARLATRIDGEAVRIAMVGLASGNAFERVGSLRALSGWAGAMPLPNLEALFADPLRWVRVEAVSTALSHGYTEFSEDPARSALEDYVAAQMAASERPESHVNMAHMHEILGDWNSAQASFRNAQRIAPENAEIMLASGLFSGRWANSIGMSDPARYRELRIEAEEALTAAVLLLGDQASEALYLLGLFLGEERPRLPAAASALQESFRLDPTNSRKAYNAAIAFQQMEEYVAAERLLLQALVITPLDGDIRGALTILYMQTQRWEDASRSNGHHLEVDPQSTELLERQAYIDSQIPGS